MYFTSVRAIKILHKPPNCQSRLFNLQKCYASPSLNSLKNLDLTGVVICTIRCERNNPKPLP